MHAQEQTSLPKEQQLLLGIYSQVNEPDGLHAICHMSHGLDPQSQLRLYQQEGAWAAVLTTCDHQLRWPSSTEAYLL